MRVVLVAFRYGSKPAALITWLRGILQNDSDAKVIVFSMWDDVLHIVSQTLSGAGINNRFCEGDSAKQVETIRLFTETADVRVLMLSSLKSAAGANLQIANHVALLDPPGVYSMFDR